MTPEQNAMVKACDGTRAQFDLPDWDELRCHACLQPVLACSCGGLLPPDLAKVGDSLDSRTELEGGRIGQ